MAVHQGYTVFLRAVHMQRSSGVAFDVFAERMSARDLWLCVSSVGLTVTLSSEAIFQNLDNSINRQYWQQHHSVDHDTSQTKHK